MQTKLEKIDSKNLDEVLEKAAKIIKAGGLVAFPTETVYGLGADAMNETACDKIFEVKRRKKDNPLIVHVSDIDMVDELVKEVTDDQKILMQRMWPGPMTLIFKASDKINPTVTAGGNTVAIRMPKDEISLKLIEKAKTPIAAPSANISTRPSPTNAGDVMSDLDGSIEMVIDGGDSKIGIESTVIDLSERPYTILRPGYYTSEDFEKYVGPVVYDSALRDQDKIPKSPGQKYKHYAPKTKMIVITGDRENFKGYIKELEKDYDSIGYILTKQTADLLNLDKVRIISDEADLEEYSHNIFTYIRSMDRENFSLIVLEGVKEEGIGIGIMNRIRKSCSNNIIYL
ncbi:MAG: L-threonylcarbamoyladenylate synthase [Finegoldia sp.]|nr:L-threonylcarbamoyladenylate synthase [Finegoldia sp.]